MNMRIGRLSLTAQIFIGTALGIVIGTILGPKAASLKFIGDIFLKLLQVVVIPLIFLVLATGTASLGDIRKIGRIGGKVLLVYELTSLIAVTLGLIVANIIEPGKGIAQPQQQNVNPPAPMSGMQLFLSIFPSNVFDAMARGDTMQVVIFSILFGLAMGMAGDRVKGIHNALEQLNQVFFHLVRIVISLAPLGVCALMAWTIGTMGLQVLIPLAKYLFGIAVACIIMIIVVTILLVRFVARLSVIQFFRHSLNYILVAFSTCSAAAALPLEFQAAERMGIKREIYGFTLPLGAMNQDGTALYQAMATVLIAQFFGVDLSFSQQFYVIVLSLLASSGTFAVPGAGLITLMIVLRGLGLPIEGLALVAGVDRIADMFRTTLNVIDDMACTLAVASTERAVDSVAFYRNGTRHAVVESHSYGG